MRRSGVLLLMLLATVTAGCGHACNAIGGSTGMVVDVPGLETRSGAITTITVCIAGSCRDTVPTEPRSPWTVYDDRLSGERLDVILTVSTDDGGSVTGSGEIRPQLQQPAGPDCVTFWYTRVVLPGDGTLR